MSREPQDRLGRPELSPLVAELARRYAQGGELASISLRSLDAPALTAVADLLGAVRIPAPTGRLTVRRLCAALGLQDPAALRAAVDTLAGPIPNRRADRDAASAARESLWEWLWSSARDVAPDGSLDDWVARVRAMGVRGGIETHRRRLGGAIAVLRRLPADGTTLAALANDALHDPHGLDRGRSVAALVMDALESATDAESIRATWERVGVAPDALSSTVLVLGLRQPASHRFHAYLSAAADASSPIVLTLEQLRRWPLSPVSEVFVLENPSVVAEAASLGWSRGPTLVCSAGHPTVAVVTLIRQLCAGGAVAFQHADFDAGGIGITAWLAEHAGTVPWHMDSASYEQASALIDRGVGLGDRVVDTPWDPRLAQLMRLRGVAVYEEQLRDELLRRILSNSS